MKPMVAILSASWLLSSPSVRMMKRFEGRRFSMARRSGVLAGRTMNPAAARLSSCMGG